MKSFFLSIAIDCNIKYCLTFGGANIVSATTKRSVPAVANFELVLAIPRNIVSANNMIFITGNSRENLQNEQSIDQSQRPRLRQKCKNYRREIHRICIAMHCQSTKHHDFDNKMLKIPLLFDKQIIVAKELHIVLVDEMLCNSWHGNITQFQQILSGSVFIGFIGVIETHISNSRRHRQIKK